ncbi:MAG: hypothetical protein WCV00_08035 [Verrucomicrobiia bacterium]|jgi:REP element-mobilizing transposase RayT
MLRKIKGRPPRLHGVFQIYDPPLYFVTFNTLFRQSLLANDHVHAAFCDYGQRGNQLGKAFIGRYVIMPNHVHLFVRLAPEVTLEVWESGLKKALSRAVVTGVSPDRATPTSFAKASGAEASGETPDTTTLRAGAAIRADQIWQPGFFDHLIRNTESYSEKWNYVRENPVRAGLVERAEDWPYQGEIVTLNRL